jgi:hypothetical protein
MLDIADLMRGGLQPEQRRAVRARLGRLSAAIGIFAFGCALAAGAFVLLGMWCFAVPPVIAAFVFLGDTTDAQTSQVLPASTSR